MTLKCAFIEIALKEKEHYSEFFYLPSEWRVLMEGDGCTYVYRGGFRTIIVEGVGKGPGDGFEFRSGDGLNFNEINDTEG